MLVKYGLDEYTKEEFWAHAVDANFGLFNNIKWEYKMAYFDKIRELFLLSEKYNIDFKYFGKKQRMFYSHVMHNDFIRISSISYRKRLSDLRRMIISVRFPTKHFPYWRIIFLGMQFGPCISYDIPSWLKVKL